MTDMIPAWVGQLGAPGLVTIAVLLTLTGRLVWHKLAERMVNEVAADRDEWRQAHHDVVEINRLYAESLPKIVESQKTVLAVVQALPRPDRESRT